MRTVQQRSEFNKRFFVNERTLTIYEKGVMTSAPHHVPPGVLPDHLRDSKRGTIKGWSSGSRKRMREFLLLHGPSEGSDLFGVTLTVPGSVPPTEAEKEQLWKSVVQKLRRSFVGAVWRLELQRRGACHWHLLCVVPSSWVPVGMPRGCGADFAYWMRYAWRESLNQLPESTQETRGGVLTCVRGVMDGAEEHACDVQPDRGGVRWLQYLQDHCSKRKQEQVALSGRHWGIVNRSAFADVPGRLLDLPFNSWVSFYRILRRWSRPTVKAACPFGSRRGWKTSRGSRGSSVWFGSVPAFSRAADWSLLNPAPLRPGLASLTS